MKCPKCGSEFKTVKHGDVEFDRCTGCQGLWFDAAEHEALRAEPGSDAIDAPSGNDYAGKPGTKLCPRCNVKMIDMVVAAQPHIKYESCGVCHGVYFDAGEFADFREETLDESWRAVMRAARGR